MGLVSSKSLLMVIAGVWSLAGMSGMANAATLLSIDINDVGSTAAGGGYSAVLDGKSGGFSFGVIDPTTYANTWLWRSDVGPMLWNGQGNPVGSFSTGFRYMNALPFVPYTHSWDGIGAEIIDGSLGISNLRLRFITPNTSNEIDMWPDPWSFTINWILPTADPTKYLLSMQWSHVISATENDYFAGQLASVIIEGTATVAPVPVPAAIWLLVSGLIGLAGASYRRRRLA